MSKINDDWHEILMTWGAYRSGNGPNRLGLGYGQTILGKMIETVRGTTCTRCIGKGKIQGTDATGWARCPVCQGRGKVHVETPGKISPAMIRSTSVEPEIDEEPDICRRIDDALLQLTIRHRIAIVNRYVDYPRRNDGDKRHKAANAWLVRIGEKPVSKKRLENLLSDARRQLAERFSHRRSATRFDQFAA